MTKKKRFGWMLATGVGVGAFLGYSNSPPTEKEDSAARGALIGAGIAAGAYALSKGQRRLGTEPSKEEIERADREAKRKNWHYYQNSAEDRYKRQRGEDDQSRGP